MPQYCLVKHRISTYVIDGADSDRNPDRIPVTGVVTFEALLDKGDSVVVTEDGVATTITLAAIEARITNGELWHRGEEGVKLFAGGPDTNPERIRYRAKFTNLIAGGKKIELKPILFEAVPGGELTLSMAQPVPGKPYPGYSATIEAGISQIEGARDEALGQVEQSVASAIFDTGGEVVKTLAGQRSADTHTGTTWAHVTPTGHRLPLGYAPDGHLDDHARTIFREDVTGTYQDTADDTYAHVVTTEQGHLLVGLRRDGSVEIPRLLAPQPGVPESHARPSAGMKLAPLAFSAPGGASTRSGAESLRVVRTYAHFPGRVRVHISNRHPVSGSTGTPVTITGAQVGVGDEAGVMSGAQELFPPSSIVPGDGTELVSRWVTLDGTDGDGLAVSLAWSGTGVKLLKGGCWTTTDTTAWDDPTTTGWAWRSDVPMYIWVEAEVPAYVPVVMVNGDSISVGSVTDNPVTDAWVAMYARAQNALPVFASWHGSSMWQWAPDTGQWDRLYPGVGLAPDAIVMAHGQNDLGSTSDLAVLQERYHELRDVYDQHFPEVPVYVGTVNASNKDETKEAVRRDFNAWLKSLPRGERGVLDFAAVLDDPTGEFLLPDYTDDTLHPNTAGQTAMAEVALAHPVTPLVPTSTQINALGGHGDEDPVYDMASFLTADTSITAGWGLIKRSGDTVNLSIQGLSTDRSDAVSIFTLPEGLRPINQIVFETTPYWSTETRETGRVTVEGAIEFRALSASHKMNLTLTYLTNDPQN